MIELKITGEHPLELCTFMQELIDLLNPRAENPVTSTGRNPEASQVNVTAENPTPAAPQQPNITVDVVSAPIAATVPLSQAAMPITGTVNPAVAGTPQTMTPHTNPPTAAPTYTLLQLAQAGAELAQAGKMNDCLALMQKYGIEAISQLKPEQFGTFATELRGLGARI